jgi:hypothetical protein
MILDKSNLNDKDLRAFLIEKCSVGYLADYIIKLRNDNNAVKNLTICDVIGCFLTDVVFEYEHPSGIVQGKLMYDDDEETLILRHSDGGYITLPDLNKCRIVNAL